MTTYRSPSPDSVSTRPMSHRNVSAVLVQRAAQHLVLCSQSLECSPRNSMSTRPTSHQNVPAVLVRRASATLCASATNQNQSTTSPEGHFPPNHIPNLTNGRQSRLLRSSQMGLQTDRPPPKPSLFAFEYTKEVALKNSLILKKYDYDFTKAIEAQSGTTASYGSKVRPMEQLKILLHNHPI